MTEIGELLVKLGVDSSELTSGMQSAEAEIETFKNQVNETQSGMDSFNQTTGNVNETISDLGDATNQAGEAVGGIDPELQAMASGMRQTSDATEAAAAGAEEMTSGAGGLISGIGAAAAALTVFVAVGAKVVQFYKEGTKELLSMVAAGKENHLLTQQQIQDANELASAQNRVAEYQKEYKALMAANTTSIQGWWENMSANWYQMQVEEARGINLAKEAYAQGVISAEELQAAITSLTDTNHTYATRVKIAAEITNELTNKLAQGTRSAEDYGKALTDGAAAIYGYSAETKNMVDLNGDNVLSVDEVRIALHQMAIEAPEAIGEVNQAWLSYQNQIDQINAPVTKVIDIKVNGLNTLDDYFRKEKYDDLGGAIGDVLSNSITGAIGTSISEVDAQQFLAPLEIGMEAVAVKMGDKTLWQASYEAAANLGITFGEAYTQISNIKDTADSMAKLDMVWDVWQTNHIKDVYDDWQTTGGGTKRTSEPRAGGGPVSFGKSYLVGEEGIEIFTPNESGTIIPNDKIGAGSGKYEGPSANDIAEALVYKWLAAGMAG